MSSRPNRLTLSRSWAAVSPMFNMVRQAARSRSVLFGSIVAFVMISVGILAPVISPYGYDDQNLQKESRKIPPIWLPDGQVAHPLGTDNFGRDTLSRLMYGARVSLLVGVVSVVLAGGIGIAVGVTAGYYGGAWDRFSMRVADVQFSFPYILLAIIIVAVRGPGLTNIIIALGLSGWMTFARTARACTLSAKQEVYVEAALAVGARGLRIMSRHILPNIAAPLLVLATFQIPSRILGEATLSFLGLGVQPPTPSWGAMLSQNRGFLQTEPWLVILPGLAIMIVTMGINQLGDGLRDMWDPKLRGRT